MNGLNQITADIETSFADSIYPAAFLAAYDQIECLASHNGRETFLVRRKSDGQQAIAKCYERKAFPVRPDSGMLLSLSGDGLPHFYEEFRNENVLCLIREYIEGTPLDIYAKENDLTREEIITIASRLCDILDGLHSRKPPVIHRDIKPENIIVGLDGKITLIDFDISRAVKPGIETDSVIFGTRGYAPPEQYGFEQTDQRADIFAFGVLLRWLVTGSVRINHNITIDPVLKETIDRCTEFSPEDRFDNIHQVKASLLSTRKLRPRVSGKVLALDGICALLFCVLGFVLGRFTEVFTPPPAKEPLISFREPLIEKAVRLQLGLDEGMSLDTGLLSQVRQLYIYGNEAYATQEECYNQNKAFHTQGTIYSLNDLDYLPNLENFFMAFQGQVNISALGRAKKLRYVELKHMQLENVIPLGDLPMLRNAVIFDAGLSDVKALENCHWLDTLDVGYNRISSMEQIGFYPYLTSLTLRGLKMESLEGLEKFSELKGLTLCQAKIDDLSALRSFSGLDVYVTPEMEPAVTELLAGTGNQVIVRDN